MDARDSQFDVAHYFDVVKRRRALLFVTPLVCMIGAYLLGAQGDDMYRATAEVRIESEQIDTEVALVDTPAVANRVDEILGERSQLIESVWAERIGETQLVGISVTSTSPSAAADGANAWADSFRAARNDDATATLEEERTELQQDAADISPQIVELETEATQLQNALDDVGADAPEAAAISAQLSTVRSEVARLEAQQRALNDRATSIDTEIFQLARTVEPAKPASEPGSPFEPKPLRAAATGLLAGIVLGIFAAGIAEVVDDPIWDATDAQRWVGSIPILASIPPLPRRKSELPITIEDPAHPVSEAFRVLRTSLQFMSIDRPVPKLMVTSAEVGDGKTTTTVNLAVALARGGSDVVLVDADLRRSTVHRHLGLQNREGVTSVLVGDTDLSSALRPVRGVAGGQVEVLTAGPTPPNPAELISSNGMRSLLDQLTSVCDHVVVDTPPMLAVSDALAMAQHVDGALMVVRVRSTSGRNLARAIERIEQSGVRILGVVLNEDPEKTNPYLSAGKSSRGRLRSWLWNGSKGDSEPDVLPQASTRSRPDAVRAGPGR